MSSSHKKTAKDQKAGAKAKGAKAAGPSKPAGIAPWAQVVARHNLQSITRRGKGFSIGEIDGAELSVGLARKWGVSIDHRRRSVLDTNVGVLRRWNSHRPAVKPEGEVQKVEAELEKVAKEIEKGAKETEEVIVEAGREVEKEAKKVEKGAVKAEKKVRERAKPRPKPKKKA